MTLKIRVKNKYAGIGYIESRTINVTDYYEAKEFVENELRLAKIGDEKWKMIDQDFDCNSMYISDGTMIMWYEILN